ncbi:hypothetical protein HPB48_009226 [Haemaphysalis longicornis]|uniref:Peptidase aspartic putative domain-containing protein n=1 Tax=Haemaphysalis longicornis TaxID=44386 RepID=A0A9J6GW30_HAELO|nr:hypothetical protein HPB48_009226 [Haemaphysalis longicornis]
MYEQISRPSAKGPTGQLLLRVILDTGSQRTFIGRDVCRALACPIKSRAALPDHVWPYPSNKNSSVNLVSVTLKSLHDDQVTTVEAFEVPEICIITSSPVNGDLLRSLESRGPYAAERELPDTFFNHLISVLIPSDF